MTEYGWPFRSRTTVDRFALLIIGLLILAVAPAEVALLIVIISVAATGLIAFRLGNYLVSVISLALLVRIAIILVDSVLQILPTPPIASGHHERTLTLLAAWSRGEFIGVLQDFGSLRIVMAHVLAPFYVLFGHSQVSGRIGIAVIGLAAGYFSFLIARKALNRKQSVFAAAVVLFWPTILYRSTVIQRETIMVVVMLGFLWAAIEWLDRVDVENVIVALTAVAMVFLLRPENLFLLAVVAATALLLRGKKQRSLLVLSALLFVPFLLFFALNFGSFTGFGTTLSPEAIDSFSQARAHGSASYLENLRYTSWLDIALYAPMKMAFYMFQPFPWQIGSPVELFVGFTTISLLFTLGLSQRGVRLLRDQPDYLVVVLSYLIVGISTYAIIETNYGSAVRRRIQFVPVILILAVIGISNLHVKVRYRNTEDPR